LVDTLKEKDHSGLAVDGRIEFRYIQGNGVWGDGLDSFGTVLESVLGSCERSGEHLGFTKGEKFLACLS
jgi:hypothetical protein